ncbi:uncharacterized protein G2W53_040239 [Senna tora]|uniref:Uncharacterized protein n=1 Tax=Senna tora TaxID=362788 RepID=A0A834SRS9_9FABA|nr:uncharacterized protein G2W53_040239 [Senna tora]
MTLDTLSMRITKPHLSIKSARIPNTTRSNRYDLDHTFHAITSPIRALNPLGFQNTTRSTGMNLHTFHEIKSTNSSIKSTQIPKYNPKHIPCGHKPHSSTKSTRIPKYNVKRSIWLTCATTR